MAKTIGAIDGGSNVKEKTNDDLVVKTNGQLFNPASVDGHSTAILESTGGSVTLEAKIDGQSTVRITAHDDITINGKIDGQSDVTLIASGDITITDKIDGGPATKVRWKAQSFTVAGGVNGGADVQQL